MRLAACTDRDRFGRHHQPAPVRPAANTSTGGGGSDDVLQRIRAPKWHSYLPGMFR